MIGLASKLSAAVGGKSAEALKSAFGMRTVEDLLRHYPRRYPERGQLTELRDLQVGEHVTVMAEIYSAQLIPKKNSSPARLKVVVGDGRDTVEITYFNPRQQIRELKPGARGLFAGKVGRFNKTLQLTQPDYEIDADDSFAGVLVPVYPATAKLASWKIAQTVRIVLDLLDDEVLRADDPVPADLLAGRGLIDLAAALRWIHVPSDLREVHAAQQRLRWDEAFVLQTVLARRRAEVAAMSASPRVRRDGGLLAAFDHRLPFTLTAGQREVSEEIFDDLAASHPMHRLLQGEVGSGKTVVALRAMLAAVDAGGQAALLAPTEVLAQQHHRSISALLGPLAEAGLLTGGELGTRVALLTGSMGAAARKRALLETVSGQAGIVVGTHALLQDRVEFHDLALVIVDEQHRFGVEQRAALAAKSRTGTRPHVLVMTATPIPRTVAMTVFGDLDVSTLRELPAGRSPLVTHVVPAVERPDLFARAWTRIREEVAAGHQAYVVCPRIGDETGEAAPAATTRRSATGRVEADPGSGEDQPAGEEGLRPGLAVLDVFRRLADGPLTGLRLGELHGRLAPADKEDVMRRFALGPGHGEGLDVVVSTTVVEVGVDVPTATVMVVLDADRFGVSQLHQLRGRVGRGSAPGLCLLVTEAPPGSPARERVEAVAATRDGFALSRLDLEQRREGDVLGAAQAGRRSSLRLLEVLRDEDVVVDARLAAIDVVAVDSDLGAHPGLRRAIAALLDDDQAEFLAKA